MENIKKIRYEMYSNSRATKYIITEIRDSDFRVELNREIVKPKFINEFKSFSPTDVHNKTETIPSKEEISYFLTEKRNSLDKEALRLKQIQDQKEAELKKQAEIEKTGEIANKELIGKKIIKGFDFVKNDLENGWNKFLGYKESEYIYNGHIPSDEDIHYDHHSNESSIMLKCSLLVLWCFDLLGKTTIKQTKTYGYHDRSEYIYENRDYSVYMYKRDTYDYIKYSYIIESNGNYFKITLNNFNKSDLLYQFNAMLYFLKKATIEKI